tara:strand:- start:1329 stop:1658 length:330 start_codon:yes stop_codon:yes gene_type:complete
MRFDYDKYAIVLENGSGTVYQDGKLMFKGDGYIAIKHLLRFTNNAEKVQQKFEAQLSMREKTKWQVNDTKEKLEQKMKEEAEKAKQSISVQSKKPTRKKPRSMWSKLTK